MVDSPQLRAGVYGRQSLGAAKSIADQIGECTTDATGQGWHVAEVYQDGSSASRYARKARDDWARLLTDLAEGRLDVLVLWEPSRGDRDLPTWAGLLATCRERSVAIRITSHGHTYDMTRPRDWRTLAEDGIDSAYESEKLSLRTRRGVASAAAAGRPPMGPAPYGYRRTYDPATGRLAGQEPDPEAAPIVREIIEKVSQSVPVSEIAKDLAERGIRPPQGEVWRRQRVREIALNPAYIGLRKHRGQTHPATWEPLINEATFYAATRVLNDPERLKLARPGRQVHLLTYLGECFCGGPLAARATYYLCRAGGHVNVRRAALDEFVVEVVLARLARADAYASLRRAGEHADREVVEARATAARLRAELDTWRVSAAKGQTSPESLAVIEARLLTDIRAADERANRAALPPALRMVLAPGEDVRARWGIATLAARREVIRTLMTVTVRPAGQNAFLPIHERVDITWKTGADTPIDRP